MLFLRGKEIGNFEKKMMQLGLSQWELLGILVLQCAEQITTNLVASNNPNVFSHSFRKWNVGAHRAWALRSCFTGLRLTSWLGCHPFHSSGLSLSSHGCRGKKAVYCSLGQRSSFLAAVGQGSLSPPGGSQSPVPTMWPPPILKPVMGASSHSIFFMLWVSYSISDF